jgi:hypothetical protein
MSAAGYTPDTAVFFKKGRDLLTNKITFPIIIKPLFLKKIRAKSALPAS